MISDQVGVTYPTDDLSDMADAIKKALTMDRALVAQAGRALIEQRYLPETHFESLQTIYQQLTKKGS